MNNFATTQQANNAKFATFAAANVEVAAWLTTNAPPNGFANSLVASVEKYGNLTVNQIAAVNKNIDKEKTPSAPKVDQDKLMQAFSKAKSNKLTRLKMRFSGFFCYPASESSVNSGGIYIKSDSKEYLGKITSGRFQKSFACDDAMSDKIIAVMNDPLAEAIAYGKQTGNCAICGRFLENKESVERGIGPICAANYGFD